jgi:hypothetical protein
MNNKDLLIGVEGIDRRGYKLYLRSLSIKKIFLSEEVDKSYSFTNYMNSKWYYTQKNDFSQYLLNSIDQNINFEEYLSDHYINVTSNYTNYVSDDYDVEFYN